MKLLLEVYYILNDDFLVLNPRNSRYELSNAGLPMQQSCIMDREKEYTLFTGRSVVIGQRKK